MEETMRSSQEQEKEVSFHCQSDQAIRGGGDAKDESGLLWSLFFLSNCLEKYRISFISFQLGMIY